MLLITRNSEAIIFIGAFYQAKVKIWVFIKSDSRYADYFQNIQVFWYSLAITEIYVWND